MFHASERSSEPVGVIAGSHVCDVFEDARRTALSWATMRTAQFVAVFCLDRAHVLRVKAAIDVEVPAPRNVERLSWALFYTRHPEMTFTSNQHDV